MWPIAVLDETKHPLHRWVWALIFRDADVSFCSIMLQRQWAKAAVRHSHTPTKGELEH